MVPAAPQLLTSPTALTVSRIDSPIGPLALAADAEGRVRGVSFGAGLEAAMRREYPAAASTAGDPPPAVAAPQPLTLPATLTVSRIDSPIGPLALAADAEGRVRGLSFGDGLETAMRREYPAAASTAGDPPPAVAALLAAFFNGDRAALGRIPWSLDGARSASGEDGFQPAVWRALLDIPCGTTLSYGEIARRVGQPGAAQAAGVALNRNPLPLVLPCHRVVGADGALVGFGGGLERKTWLLRHEGALLI